MKLKNKIFIPILLLILIGGSIASVFVFYFTLNTLVDQKRNILQDFALQKKELINVEFDASVNLVEAIAKNINLEEYLAGGLNLKEITEYLNNYNLGNKYSAIYVIDKTGLTLASTDPTFVGQNYYFREYFQEALQGETSISMAIGVTSKEPGYYFSTPIFDNNNQINSIIVVKLKPEIISERLLKDYHILASQIYFLDKFGVIIHSSDSSSIYKTFGDLSASSQKEIFDKKYFQNIELQSLGYPSIQTAFDNFVSDSETKLTQNYEFNDKSDVYNDKIINITSIYNTGFYIVIARNYNDFLIVAQRNAFDLSIIVFLTAVIVFIFIYFFVRKIIQPVEVLKNKIETVEAKNLTEIKYKQTNDEVSDLASEFNNLIDRINLSRQQIAGKVDQQTKDIKAKSVNLRNQQKAILNILEDVETEKEKSERLADDLEKFKLAVDNASDHILLADSEGTILYANKGVEKITGFPVNELVGHKAGTKQNWGGQMDKEFYKKLWHRIKTEKKPFTGYITNKRKNGQKYDAYASITPVLDRDKEIMYFLAIERDVTKEKEVDRAKTEFVSLASHQLRTPLSTINWYVEMMLDGDTGKINKEQKDYLTEIHNSNQRMVDLVNSLLNVSRIEMGTLAVDPRETDLKNIAESVLKELEPQILEKEIKVKTNIKQIPDIMLDPKLIRIVFQNLLSNAVKYNNQKGKLELKIAKRKKDVLVEVKDTGYGIPKHQQSKIFTKLFRADNVQSKDTDGTGLGLYVAKSVIRRAGGKIWFKSVLNKGTTFYFTLPLKGMKKNKGTKGLNYTK